MKDEDIRHDDLDYNVAVEPKSAKAWINLLEEIEKAFEDWNDHCRQDRQTICQPRPALEASQRTANSQCSGRTVKSSSRSIYAKPPVPVVVPKFHDRRPVYQAASELMERCATVAFDLTHINDIMMQIRDDVAIAGRGVAWCRYEGGKKNGKKNGYNGYDHEKVCIDFKHRRDFLHSVSRCWYEVTWVAAASYLTRQQARERFYKY